MLSHTCQILSCISLSHLPSIHQKNGLSYRGTCISQSFPFSFPEYPYQLSCGAKVSEIKGFIILPSSPKDAYFCRPKPKNISTVQASYETLVQHRIAHEKLATRFIKAINDLWYDKGIEIVLFRNQLIDKRASEILNLHNYARKIVGKPIEIEQTTKLLEAMLGLDLCPARIDIGRLASEWIETSQQ